MIKTKKSRWKNDCSNTNQKKAIEVLITTLLPNGKKLPIGGRIHMSTKCPLIDFPSVREKR